MEEVAPVNPRVLVVQPRETLARATGRHLQAAGFEPTVVLDADTAVRQALADPHAAVVADLTLPVLDGWCVLAALGHTDQTVIAYGRPDDARRAAALGAAATVQDRGDVVRVLNELLRELERV
jgi:DNA-binding response OmpR family regulator